MLDSPEGVCPGQARFEYPATFVLFSNCPYSAQTAPVGSGQLRLGRYSVECGLVGCSRAWWNDRQNDHLSKQ
jgi:hypothetical protein